ncbi:hypothetical protein AN901_202308 [Pseudomonas syringae pv. theae]|nr:hypothetical protein AN901_202308 [Pseudomonas syringae pv. theae]
MGITWMRLSLYKNQGVWKRAQYLISRLGITQWG